MTENEAIKTFAAIAFQYGPFFFSIFFLLVVVGMAHKRFKKVNMRKDPVATIEEKKCYKMYFIASFAASLLLVFISVGWWMYAHMSKHVLRGTIYGFQEGHSLIAYNDDIFIRERQRLSVLKEKFIDYHFVIVRDNPFSPGQKFVLEFYPAKGFAGDSKPEPVPLDIIYSGKEYHNYKLEKKGKRFFLAKNE
jgi:cbb3-type cytochrome oxidase subunit 3